jgi:nucleoid-associated protein YgaU
VRDDADAGRARGLTASATLVLGYLAVSGLLGWGTAGAWTAVHAPGPASIDAALALTAAAAAWLALTWLTAVTVLTVLTAVVAGLGSRAHRRVVAIAPLACRRLAGALLGLTVAGAPLVTGAAVASAVPTSVVVATAGAAGSSSTDPSPLPSTDGLDRPAAGVPAGWTPDRPAVPHRQDARSGPLVRLVASTPRTGHAVVEDVVVRRGDTLWDIAARHLGPDASPAEVAAEWPRWHAANSAVIGPDPDLLLPGQRLLPPRR